MQFEHSEKVQELIQKVDQFLTDNLYPVEDEIQEYIDNASDRWTIPPLLEELKAKAKSEGLWNFFLPDSDEYGYGLNNLEYLSLIHI